MHDHSTCVVQPRLIGVVVAGERLPLCEEGDCVSWSVLFEDSKWHEAIAHENVEEGMLLGTCF